MEDKSTKTTTGAKNSSKLKEEKPAAKRKPRAKDISMSQEEKQPTVKRKPKTVNGSKTTKEKKPTVKTKPKAKNRSKTQEANLSSSEKRTIGWVIGAVAIIIGSILMISWGLEDNSIDDGCGVVIIGGIIIFVGALVLLYTEGQWNGWSREWFEESDKLAKEWEIKRKREQEEYEIWKMKMGL